MPDVQKPQTLVTHLKLWLPDKKSPWGRRLKFAIKTVGKKRISMPIGFAFATLYGIRTVTRENSRTRQGERWNSVFDPQQPQAGVFDALTQQLPNPCALRVFVRGRQLVRYCVVINDGETPAAVARREIRGTTHEAVHQWLKVTPDYQSKGIGSRLLCNAVTWYSTLEKPKINKIKITAGLSAGGGVWPKYGFRPVDENEWIKIHKQIRSNFRRMPIQAKAQFQKVREESLSFVIKVILKEFGPKGIWEIAALDHEEDIKYIQIASSRKPDAPKWGLGTFLLRGTRWEGVLDLTDKDALNRFKNYFLQKEKDFPLSYPCKDVEFQA